MSVPSQISDLMQAKLSGRKIDVVEFMTGLLSLARETGEIHCSLATEHSLRFGIANQAHDVALDAARGKLRMLCARLSALCDEAGSGTVSPYGGEGIIHAPSHNGVEAGHWTVRFKNTPSEHEFTIVPAKVEKPQRAPAALS